MLPNMGHESSSVGRQDLIDRAPGGMHRTSSSSLESVAGVQL